MEPITSALVISGVIGLAKKAAEEAAGEAGKMAATGAAQLWRTVREKLGLAKDPPPASLEPVVKAMLDANPEVVPEVERLLQEYQKATRVILIPSITTSKQSASFVKGSVTNVNSNTGTITNHNEFNA